MGRAFKEFGYDVLTVDLFENADLQANILLLTRKEIVERFGGEPDFIWASPPCTAFSVASIGTHWGGGYRVYEPRTDTARLGLALTAKTREIMTWFPGAKFCIENPRGVLRKMPVFADLRRETITFCQYGEKRMKPTDIWTNLDSWNPRPACKNGMPCHEAAPRGSQTGTQGMKNAYLRGALPFELCLEICRAARAKEVSPVVS